MTDARYDCRRRLYQQPTPFKYHPLKYVSAYRYGVHMASDTTTDSNKVLVRIRHAGKAIDIIGMVMNVACIVMLVLGCFGLAMAFVAPDVQLPWQELIADSSFVRLVDATIPAGSIPQHARVAINLFAFDLSQFVLIALISILRGLVRELSTSEHPFRAQTAAQLRRNIWWFIPLFFWNLLAAIMLVLVALLLSYLIDYGAYLQNRADETMHVQEQVIVSLAEITENKSGQTGSHVLRVAEYTRILAEELGYPQESIDELRLAATMHDIGKLLVPTEILEKPGRLTDEEYAIIKRHTTDGGRLLENVDGEIMQLSRTIALDHHERWDGRGYARGLDGETISLEGRIVAVADVYDALTSRRSYKEAWDSHEAYDEIVRCAGTQFDPTVVEAFKKRYADIDATRIRLADNA